MSAFAQTPSGDLDISTGNLAVVRDLGLCTAQKLTNRFKFFLGEWFLDSRVGIPYFQVVYVKNPDLQAVGQLFKRVALQTPGVASVAAVGLDFFAAARSLISSIKVVTQTGAVITGGPGQAFIVTQNGSGQS